MANNWNVSTDDYDIYTQGGDTTQARPGSPEFNTQDDLVTDAYYFPMAVMNNSMMDQDPNNTGPTNDFWTDYPISIDINGNIFYNGENTGINVRGPAGFSHISFDDLTEEQKASLKGEDGADGVDGRNGQDGQDGKDGYSAYQLWLIDNGWEDHPEQHPLSDFYQYIADLANAIVVKGTGEGSIILNYVGANSVASGRGATAMGEGTSAAGENSIVGGYGTIANYNYQTVLGKYNNNNADNAFEIGNGNINLRKNIFSITWTGDLLTTGDVTDGNNNKLSNKVDKIQGKQLSTNDFTDLYKNFIDNYTIDTALSTSSENPVTNKAIASAINEVRLQSGKPTKAVISTNTDLNFLFPNNLVGNTLEGTYYSELKWNPGKNVFKIGSETSTFENILSFGYNLEASNDYQLIFGKYNNPRSIDIVEIGYGSNANNLKNLFTITRLGDVTAAGDIIDGEGNTLSDKQDSLTYDLEPTQNSNNIVKSGDLYEYLVSHGINPSGGLNIPEITILQNQIANLTTRVRELEIIVAGYTNPREIPDDTFENNIYHLGVDRGELYIKLNEDEEEENNGDNTEQNTTE